MAGLTKAQKAEKVAAEARAKTLAVAGLTEEQFAALGDEEKAKILTTLDATAAAPKGYGDDDGPTLVKMIRDVEGYPEPHEAQVHPDEVDNYRPGGWTEA
ncbi:hypothetical protein [Pandoraea apista]|uniref:Uncharacterized protein n=1 Tax=Pandoraea apista TaxID=93218 RepID=A0A5E5P4F5_9BURK|nr:hypothetical protein [Pandoraea apista]AVF41510.1 hypothetical protein AL486_18760 [Pandoraea apista]OXS89559.1 hypothetical protein B7H01_19915 [Pandoraea apista]VVG70689.1 hypothetical protein PAP18089_01653 [Pandoraea apista]